MRLPLHRFDRYALAVLALLPFVWYATPIFSDQSYYLGDLTAQYNPWWTFAHESLKAGHLPLWNPYTLGGMPYHVNPENSLFYPLKWPLIFLSFSRAAAILRALDSVVAATGTYLLLRSLGTRRVAGLAAALMFTFGSFMSYKFLHIPYINTAVWFPWQLLLLNRLVRRTAVVTCLLLALVTAVSFLGGSPGAFLVCQMTLGFFFLFAALRLLWSQRWARLARLTGGLAAAAALVVGLTFVLLAPAYDFIRFTPRALGLADRSTLTDFALIGRGLWALLFPYAHYGYGAPYPPLYPIFFVEVPYLGAAAVLLALYNLGSRRYRHLLAIGAAVVAFSVLAALGTRAPLLPWLASHVAVFSWFRWPHDYLLMAYLVLPILAGTGLDRLQRASRRTRRRLAALTVIYVLIGLLALRQPSALAALLVGAGFAVVTILWIRPPRLAGALLLGAVALDLFVFGYNYRLYLPRQTLDQALSDDALDFVRKNTGFDRVALAAPGLGTHFQGQERIFGDYVPLFDDLPARNRSLTDLDPWLRRQDPTGWSEELWARRTAFHNLEELFADYPVNAAMILGYQEVSGYDPFMIDRVRTLYRTLPQLRAWDLLGTRYVVTPNRIAHERLRLAFAGERLNVYENPGRFPRAVIPRAIEHVPDSEDVLVRLGAPEFDPRHLALFEEPLPAGWGDRAVDSVSAPEAARIVEYLPERVTVEADLRAPGFLLLHDVYDPGWKAYAGGLELDVWRANYCFRAVHLPGGRQRVVFVYRPARLLGAASISATCWLLCLTVVSVAALRPAGARQRARYFEHAETPVL